MTSETVIVKGGEYQGRVFKMHLKLRDQQLKTITRIHRLLYKTLMVTTNPKSITDTHTIKKKGNASTWFRGARGTDGYSEPLVLQRPRVPNPSTTLESAPIYL